MTLLIVFKTFINMIVYLAVAGSAAFLTSYFGRANYFEAISLYLLVILCYNTFKVNKFLVYVLTNPQDACDKINNIAKEFKKTTNVSERKDNGNKD